MSWLNQAKDFWTEGPPSHSSLITATGASFLLGLAISSVLLRRKPRARTIQPSPLKTLVPSLSPEEIKKLPLPLDVLPGARDVPSPYGSIRVYEWGPEDGPKVLLVHGITTPTLALGGLAHALVDKGCRVMLFDLFGRGYSDNPSDLPQDERLFSSQIFIALASSPLSWTGADSGKFCLLGYSLGGGISVAFASYFASLLSSLVLISPAGLIQDRHISLRTRIARSQGLLPEGLANYLAGRHLKAGPLIKPKKTAESKGKIDADDAINQEIAQTSAGSPQRVLSRQYPSLSTAGVVSWQVHCHGGFVEAFLSSNRFGPIYQQNELGTWQRLGRILAEQNSGSGATKLRHGKVLICSGADDPIIVKDDLLVDAPATLQGHVDLRFFPAGHEFPSTLYDELSEQILKFIS